MRAMTGVFKHDKGMFHVRKKVPKGLEKAVARVLGRGKEQQLFLQQSLGTKDLVLANKLAKPILIKFDRIIADAQALVAKRPVRTSLSGAEIKALADAHYFALLQQDEEERREGTGSEPVFQAIAQQLTAEGVEFDTPFKIGGVPSAGLSDREIHKRAEQLEDDIASCSAALAKGDITVIAVEVADLLDVFRLAIDPTVEDYRKLAMAVLSAHVKGLRDIAKRSNGERFAYGT